ncbi:MAG TPA: hypothetical protein VM223_04580 [Planctomycetota bacterium]|nr:hypothetical protein [Planctomycetota bacterium]
MGGAEHPGAPQLVRPAAAGEGGIKALLAEVGLDERDITERFARHGALTKGQYEAFAKKGLSEQIINDVLTDKFTVAKMHLREARTNSEEFAGGAEQFKNLIDWGSGHYSPEEQQRLQARLDNPFEMLSAVKEIYADHQVAIGGGQAQPLIEGGQTPPSGAAGYKTRREVELVMGNPRYYNDSAFRAEVDAKLANTPESILPIT